MKTHRWSPSQLLLVLGSVLAVSATTACEADVFHPTEDCHYDAQYRLQCGWEPPAADAREVTEP